MINLLEKYYHTTPGKTAFMLQGSGERIITYDQLAVWSTSLGKQLIGNGCKSKTALLIYSDVLDFIPAFLACQYAGIIPVPVLFAGSKRQSEKILQIQSDSRADIILSGEGLAKTAGKLFDTLEHERKCGFYFTTSFREKDIAPDFSAAQHNPVAFLQYTSGSTYSPKGVVISQENLSSNQRMIGRVFSTDPSSVLFSWLPFQHDMGLVGNILHNIYAGSTCVLMSPYSFMQQPLTWLRGITDHRVTHSGAPNFAYDYCVSRISEIEKATLDLSSWQVAFNGSEPVRHDTMKRFSTYFGKAGFKHSAFYPCYGLAEATLLVSGLRTQEDIVTACPAVTTNNGKADWQTVSCGAVPEEIELLICKDGTVCREGEEGEILVSGPNITSGYWNRDNTDTFLEKDNKKYLRTGDLGFLKNSQLFVCGRIKEMLIVRGVNLYPYEAEQKLGGTHDSIEENGVALFQTSTTDADEVVLVAEIKRSAINNIPHSTIIDILDIKAGEILGVIPYDIVIVQPMGIPRTTSGKIRRLHCKNMYEEGTLKMIASKLTKQTRHAEAPVSFPDGFDHNELAADTAALQEYLAQLISVRNKDRLIHKDDYDKPLFSLGLDSLRLVELINKVNADFHIQLDLETMVQYNSFNDLIKNIQALVWLKKSPRKGGRIVV